jgi:hypothetical protein
VAVAELVISVAPRALSPPRWAGASVGGGLAGFWRALQEDCFTAAPAAPPLAVALCWPVGGAAAPVAQASALLSVESIVRSRQPSR